MCPTSVRRHRWLQYIDRRLPSAHAGSQSCRVSRTVRFHTNLALARKALVSTLSQVACFHVGNPGHSVLCPSSPLQPVAEPAQPRPWSSHHPCPCTCASPSPRWTPAPALHPLGLQLPPVCSAGGWGVQGQAGSLTPALCGKESALSPPWEGERFISTAPQLWAKQ